MILVERPVRADVTPTYVLAIAPHCLDISTTFNLADDHTLRSVTVRADVTFPVKVSMYKS